MLLKSRHINFLLLVCFFYIVSPSIAAPNTELNNDQEFDKKVGDFIINHPEIIIEALEKYKKNKEEIVLNKINSYIKNNLNEIQNTETSPYVGNKDADVTIVMFFDYSCGYCKKDNEIINELIATDKNIRVIYKPYAVLGEQSSYLTKIALAVYLQYPEKFKEFHDECMGISQLSENTMKSIFKKYDIDFSKIEVGVGSRKVQEIQNQTFLLGKNLYISAVPTFIINGDIYSGMLRLNDLVKIVQESRDKKV